MAVDDEDANSILAVDTNRAMPGNMGMQVAPPNGQLFNQCKWRHMVVKF